MIHSSIFRDLPATSFRGNTSSYQVLDYKCVCAFRQTCNCPSSDQPEPGRMTEIVQNTLPVLWILLPTLGGQMHVYAAVAKQHKGLYVEKVWKSHML